MILSNPAKHISLTLRGKIVAWALFSTVGAMLVLTIENVTSTREREQAHAFEALEAEADRYARQVRSVFTSMEADIALLATVQGLQDLERVRGEDRTEAVRRQVAEFFAFVMGSKPHYAQVRLVELATGQDLVQVTREDGADRQPPSVGTSTDPGFSKIPAPRVNGQITGPPVLRLSRPMFDASGTPFAVLMIDADFDALLHAAAPTVASNVRATVVTDTGDYMMFERGITAPPLVFRQDPAWRASAATEALKAARAGQPIQGLHDHAIVIRKIRPSGDSPAAFHLVTTMAQADLFATVNAELQAHASLSFLIAMLVFLVTGTGSLLTSSQLMRPLRETLNLVKTSSEAPEPLKLHRQTHDEIGELANAFLSQTNALLPAAVRARAVFDSAGHAILVCKDGGEIEEANDAAAALFGYDTRDMIGLPVARLFAPDSPALETVDTSADTPGGVNERLGRHRDGATIHLAVSASRARFADANHLILIMQDVSEAKLAEARVQKLVARLERSNEELDQFAYITSHDLKAPLRVIANAAGWLAEDLEAHLTEDTRDTLALIQTRVKRMGRLLDALLDHSRIGRAGVEPEWTSFASMMRDIDGLLEDHAGYEIVVQPDLLARQVVRLPLQSVLLNLISNAIRHHDRPTGTIHVGFRDLGDRVEYSVTDDGPGIPTSFHEKVFQPFQTLKPRDRVDTTGIGLAMVRKQVTLIGGDIRLVSDGQRGSAFFVVWPNPDSGEIAPARAVGAS